METLSLFDVLKRFQFERLDESIVVLDYENYEYIFCNDLKKKFPTWKEVEIETIKGSEFLSVYSDSVYYIYFVGPLKDILKQHFSLV